MYVQQFRHAVQLILGNLTPDVDVKCVDPTLGGHYTPFPQVLAPLGLFILHQLTCSFW